MRVFREIAGDSFRRYPMEHLVGAKRFVGNRPWVDGRSHEGGRNLVQGLFIPADSERSLEVRNFETLDRYQAAVGGWIEAVDVPPLGASLYVNEEELLRGMPFNSRATLLWPSSCVEQK